MGNPDWFSELHEEALASATGEWQRARAIHDRYDAVSQVAEAGFFEVRRVPGNPLQPENMVCEFRIRGAA